MEISIKEKLRAAEKDGIERKEGSKKALFPLKRVWANPRRRLVEDMEANRKFVCSLQNM